VGFLDREAATKDYRLDAVHLAICLHAYGVLEPAASDAGMCLLLPPLLPMRKPLCALKVGHPPVDWHVALLA